jgi:hypothetical protein
MSVGLRDIIKRGSKIELGEGFYVYSGSDGWYIGRAYLHRKRRMIAKELKFNSLSELLLFVSELNLRMSDYKSFADLCEAHNRFIDEFMDIRNKLEIIDEPM